MNNQSGNILIFILIAIILIGVLTVSLSRSSNTSNDTGSYEQNQIAASEILRYAKSVEVGVQNLLARGCGENEISFWHDSDGNGTEDAGDNYYNATAPTDRSCHVFQPEGIGLTYTPPKENWLDDSFSTENHYGEWFTTSTIWAIGIGTDGSGSNCLGGPTSGSCRDLFTGVPYIKLEICKAINRNLKWGTDSSGLPIQDSGVGYAHSSHSKFDGTYSGGNQIGSANPNSDNFSGVYSGCIEGDTGPVSGSYHFFNVLHAR